MPNNKKWRSLPGPGDICLCYHIVNDALLEAKIYEIEKCKENNVFEPVQYVGQKIVSSSCVITEKLNNGKKCG